mgnify:CR=1 FL=1
MHGYQEFANVSDPVLRGIRVVEAATMIMAPSASVVLADFGADVIKLESPGMGDPNRYLHLIPGMPKTDYDFAFQQDNRNKKFLALDVKNDEGRAIFYKLIETADVFITNHRLQALEKLKMTWDDLHAVNPKLIYAHGTGYGETGAEKNDAGYDRVAYWSRSGFEMSVFPIDGWLYQIPPGTGDHPTGMSLVAGIMMGLYGRDRTGKGCKVSSSLLANGAWSNSDTIQAKLVGAEFPEKRPRHNAYNFGNQYYRTSDERVFKITMVNAEKVWQGMCRAIGRSELIQDPRYKEYNERLTRVPELIQLFDEAFSANTMDYWIEALSANDVPHSMLSEYEDVIHDKQMHETGVFIDVDHPKFGTAKTVNTPFELSGQTKVPAKCAAPLGADTESILKEMGMTQEAIDALAASGVVQKS